MLGGLDVTPQFSFPTGGAGGLGKTSKYDAGQPGGGAKQSTSSHSSYFPMQSVLVSVVQGVLQPHIRVLEFSYVLSIDSSLELSMNSC